MRTIWLVIKHEIITVLSKPSFWLATLIFPVFFIAINAFAAIQDNDQQLTSTRDTSGVGEHESVDENIFIIGLVDEGSLISEIPENVPPDLFREYPDLVVAQDALANGEIEQFVFIPVDYSNTGEVTVFAREFQILSEGDMGVAFQGKNAPILAYLLNYNLTKDTSLVQAIHNPTPGNLAERHIIDPKQEMPEGNEALAELVASVLPYLFYFVLIISSSYLMRSVVKEKENRTAEVLLLSLSPRQLMLGKILGLSVVALIQLTIWLSGGLLSLSRGASYMNVSAFQFAPDFWFWFVLFLILGFLLYGSIMAAAGAIAPSAKEATQVVWLLIIPFMPTLMFSREFVEDPHGTLALVLSLFPLSAPGAMVTRLAFSNVPLWQLLLSVTGLAITTYFVVVLAARFFRAGNLLSTEAFNWRRFASGWRE
ncbi:MAG: ABC transporter permease [Anaerolineales bacterium]|jgi:ABC-2 type transport system permease protein